MIKGGNGEKRNEYIYYRQFLQSYLKHIMRKRHTLINGARELHIYVFRHESRSLTSAKYIKVVESFENNM